MTSPLKTVLVLCTGNSCRSQMAEVLLNHDLAGQVRALSAGTRPQPKVAENAIKALQLLDLPTDGLYPKDIDQLLDEPVDLVVTVCDNAKETCPFFTGQVDHRLHMGFEDPAEATGTEEEILLVFRKVRDQIRKEFKGFLMSVEN